MGGRLFLKIYGGAFDKPFDQGISIDIELTQASTGKVCKKIITPAKVSTTELWLAPNGIDLSNAEPSMYLKSGFQVKSYIKMLLGL